MRTKYLKYQLKKIYIYVINGINFFVYFWLSYTTSDIALYYVYSEI